MESQLATLTAADIQRFDRDGYRGGPGQVAVGGGWTPRIPPCTKGLRGRWSTTRLPHSSSR
jgi:hypothetical protein